MIDSHVHLWTLGANRCTWPTPDLSAIHRDFTLADWREAAGNARALLVQSQADAADTDWLLMLAGPEPAVAGVVGWADLHAPDASARIAALATDPKLRGLRPMVQDQPADWYDDPALDPALAAMAQAGLVLDALIRPHHLAALGRLADRHPMLTIVVEGSGAASHFYAAPSPAVVARVTALEAACARFGVPLPAAALQFPLRNPAVAAVIPGMVGRDQVAATLRYAAAPIPAPLWDACAAAVRAAAT